MAERCRLRSLCRPVSLVAWATDALDDARRRAWKTRVVGRGEVGVVSVQNTEPCTILTGVYHTVCAILNAFEIPAPSSVVDASSH